MNTTERLLTRFWPEDTEQHKTMADNTIAGDAVTRAHASRGCWAPELRGKAAIVTGAGRLRGIGRMVALELARNGVNIVLTGTGRDAAQFPPDEQEIGWRDIESVADEIAALGVRALPAVMDISNESDVEHLMARAAAEFGRLDIVINNASTARGGDRVPIIDLPLDLWRQVMDVNVMGTMLMSRHAAQCFIRQGEGGVIVNISSIASKVPMPNTAAYAASKAAVDMLTRSMALELGRHQIRVNAINPGAVETSRLDDLGRGDEWHAATSTAWLGWASDGMDIAHAATFLCTTMGAWITGQCINVDGGRAWS